MCTGLKLRAKDGSIVHGRTLEFGIKLDISCAVVPRGYQFTGTTPEGKGISYTSKYGVVGAIAYNAPAILDGINEAGLSVGTFYFPDFAEYAEMTPGNRSKGLSPLEFSNWIITQFATVEEVKDALTNISIFPTVIKEWGNTPPPLHYIVFDKSGKSIVIEPRGGKLKVYDSKLGVLTNSPGFDWHQLNLRNYVNLRAVNAPPLKIEGVELIPFGQGSGMAGIPGDFTPPSRFVQAAIFEAAAIPSDNAQKAIFQMFHILNHFDIPVGTIRQVENGTLLTDYTLLTCARDPQALQFYFRTYDDQTIRMIDLKKFDLNAKAIKTLNASTFAQQPVVDISKDLK